MNQKYGMLRKGLLLLAIPFTLQIIFLGVLLKSQSDSFNDQKMAIHSKDVIVEVEQLKKGLVAVRGDLLGRAFTGNVDANPYEADARATTLHLEKLHESVSDNPPQQEKIDKIASLMREYLNWVGESYKLLGIDKHKAEERIRTSGAATRLSAIDVELNEFLAIEEGLDHDRQGLLYRRARFQFLSTGVGTFVTMLTAAFLLHAFSQGFARRVGALVDNAHRLAEGRPLVAPICGKDEIGLLAEAFGNMAKSLEERDRENEMFIYSVSHDLRSPLVNLQGFSRELSVSATDLKLLLDEMVPSPEIRTKINKVLESDMKVSIRFIQTAVTRLSGIIDSLLRLSRAGRVEYRMDVLDMNALIARVVDSQSDSTALQKARIEVGDLPPAWGDVTAVEQIFSNLLTNAVKYLDPSRSGRIDVSGNRGRHGESFVTYEVKDNGLGIPAPHQSKLFIAFQRLHPQVTEGQGVGLALVRRMVERHGGRIWAESESGVGTTFFVTLLIPKSEANGFELMPTRNGISETGAKV
jgi:signal transduction histidine kinase